jgi:hypothetical protein
MKRILAVVTAALGLLASTGQATAAPGDDALQLAAAAQAAAGAQAAGAQSGAVQSQPSNKSISVRVLSPGDDGDVTQSNTVGSNATAANANITGQSADQTQSGSCGCSGSGTQATGQEAKSDQSAAAASYAKQSGASNTNIPVRVLSSGDDGDVEQSNSVDSDATAANINATGQSAEQASAGGSGTQAVGQEAKSGQDAAAASAAKQKGAENTNISVRVLSPGKNGNVTQSNTAGSSAKAGNLNLTGQKADQGQAGSGGAQAIGQKAKSDQSALALSAAKQDEAQNRNIPVRVLSPGKGGDVTQSNSVDSKATAGNLNATKQYADRAQGGSSKCGCASDGTQAIGQEAKNEQSAGALSAAFQSGASNTNTPVRVDSKGGDGDVTQSNSVGSRATALNINLTGQKADQAQSSGDCYCASGGTQAIGQEAKSDQSAAAASLAAQLGGRDKCGCGSSSSGNTNAPVRIGSYGGGGSVEQSNDVGSSAGAGNLNLTGQTAGQGQGGSGTQAIGQEAKSDQDALALSAALQSGASNTNAPVRVDSKGSDGDVTQSNTAGSRAAALNGNLTKQDADQGQRGSTCGCDSTAVQAIGQEAKNEQGAGAFSLALQQGARNENTPVRVGSYGGGGSVEQSNNVGSSATAVNLNALKRDADQSQAGGGGIAIQAIGQKAKNEQSAIGLSAAIQSGASNSSAPVVVGGSKGYDKKGRGCTCGSKGHYDKGHSDGKDYGRKSRESGGSVSQSNNVGSAAKALNVNLLHQGSTQWQDGGRCGCHKGVGIQASGQSAKSSQGALAASLGLQCGARNGGTSAESHYGSEPRAYSKPRKEGYC